MNECIVLYYVKNTHLKFEIMYWNNSLVSPYFWDTAWQEKEKKEKCDHKKREKKCSAPKSRQEQNNCSWNT